MFGGSRATENVSFSLMSPNPEGETLAEQHDREHCELVVSFLGNRTQYVKVEPEISKELEFGNYGVSQGSVLVRHFNLINENDLPACHADGESLVCRQWNRPYL